MENKEIMKTKDVSKYLMISEEYVRRLMKKGDIPYVKILNKIIFQKEAIDKWLSDEKTIKRK